MSALREERLFRVKPWLEHLANFPCGKLDGLGIYVPGCFLAS